MSYGYSPMGGKRELVAAVPKFCQKEYAVVEITLCHSDSVCMIIQLQSWHDVVETVTLAQSECMGNLRVDIPMLMYLCFIKQHTLNKQIVTFL